MQVDRGGVEAALSRFGDVPPSPATGGTSCGQSRLYILPSRTEPKNRPLRFPMHTPARSDNPGFGAETNAGGGDGSLMRAITPAASARLLSAILHSAFVAKPPKAPFRMTACCFDPQKPSHYRPAAPGRSRKTLFVRPSPASPPTTDDSTPGRALFARRVSWTSPRYRGRR